MPGLLSETSVVQNGHAELAALVDKLPVVTCQEWWAATRIAISQTVEQERPAIEEKRVAFGAMSGIIAATRSMHEALCDPSAQDQDF
jgi:hypothetical protein